MIEVNRISEIRNAYRDYIYQLSENDNRDTYHLTVVYQNRTCFEQTRNRNKDYCMSSIFSKFYVCRLLPLIMNTQNFTRVSHRENQPITVVFPEKHKERYTYHHHAVLSVKKEFSYRLDDLIDKELIDELPFKNIQSIYLTKREPRVINYASKSFSEMNDDVLIFNPNQKITN